MMMMVVVVMMMMMMTTIGPSGMMTMTIATSLLWAAPAFTLLPHEPALAARCGQFKSKYKYGAKKIQNYKYISELQRCKPRHTLHNAP